MAQEEKGQEQAQAQDKIKRIAVAATAAGVLLFAFLFVVLIIQFAQMGVRNSEAKELEREIQTYRQSLEQDERVLDDYLNGEGLYYLALMQGWKTR